jgi:ArsR family transcriptional regulator, arsenate/arsenite/antimonite-responsive transcriptional repressor
MADKSHPPTNLLTLADRLKVLAEPNRLLILDLLMQGIQCNCELGDALKMPPNLISHHLRVLRQAGLVNITRDPLDARWVYYSLNWLALDEIKLSLGVFFDPARPKSRSPVCGPRSTLARVSPIALAES